VFGLKPTVVCRTSRISGVKYFFHVSKVFSVYTFFAVYRIEICLFLISAGKLKTPIRLTAIYLQLL